MSEINGGSVHAEEAEKGNGQPAEKITRSITGIKWALVVVGILSTTFLFALDNSIVADIQPKIIQTFGEIDKLPWLSVAFALGSAASTLIWASLFSTFDAKVNYLVSLLLFEIGSAICGAANMMDVLIFGRALAGLGGAGLYVGVITLLSALTTPTERPLYVASTGLIWGTGSVLGPVIGGAFADSKATWRWSFYINLVVAAVFVPVYFLMLPSVDPQPQRKAKDKIAGLDFVGAILIMGAFCCGVVGLSFGGSLFAWWVALSVIQLDIDSPTLTHYRKSATIIVLLVFSVVLTILFGIQQVWTVATTAETRLLPVQYFKSRTLLLMFILGTISAAPLFIPVYFIPLFFQFTKGDSALDAAVRLLPFMFMAVFFSLLNGAVMGKDGRYAPWYIISAAIVIAGSALMFTVDENTSTSRIYGYSALLGIGAGCIIQTGFIVAQAVVPRSEMSSSVAFINLAQIGGLVLCLTLANTIFLNLAQKYVRDVLPDADPNTIKAAISGSVSTLLRTLSPEVQKQIMQAVISAINKTYVVVIAFGSAELLLSFGLKWERVYLQM
ncbi:MAG: hypothetical protein M1840_007084 [Geoglossum simile]|nr:MAG: hypothetical protein M1840_007084 [Geoglossum simile]